MAAVLVAVGATAAAAAPTGTLGLSAASVAVPSAPIAAPATRPTVAGPASASAASPGSTTSPGSNASRADSAKLPLRFEANRGQSDPKVRFLARSAGYTAFLTPNDVVLQLTRWQRGDSAGQPTSPKTGAATDTTQSAGQLTGAVLHMRLAGANPDPVITGQQQLPGVTNYLLGNDPARWHTDVPSYAGVRYAGVYPGVDLSFYGSRGGAVEYDVDLAPGVSPGAVALDFAGAEKVSVDAAGDLVLDTAAGVLRQPKPTVYQQVSGSRKAVQGGYQLRGKNTVGFWIGAHDSSLPVVIDPELVYSTYLGGDLGLVAGDGAGAGTAIAVDGAGSAYVTGLTTSPSFPTTTGAFEATFPGLSTDTGLIGKTAYVSKLSPDGSSLVYSTYLGPTGIGLGIAVDSSAAAPEAVVAGITFSDQFPMMNPVEATNKSTAFNHAEGFVTKLTADGSGLVYSTYLGGTTDYPSEGASAVAVDASGAAYITGTTGASDFTGVTATSLQPVIGGTTNAPSAYITKLGSAGELAYSTYLGGSAADAGNGIAVDSAGRAYVTGSTTSTDFPGVTADAVQPTNHAIDGKNNVFVAEVNGDGSDLVYATYLGGDGGTAGDFFGDVGLDISVDTAGNAYVFGGANSFGDASLSRFPTTPSALQHDCKLQPEGPPALGGLPGSPEFCQSGFVAKIDAGGTGLGYATYLGGSAAQEGVAAVPAFPRFPGGIAVDSAGHAYVAGITRSTDFPIKDPIASSDVRPCDGLPCSTAFITELTLDGSAVVFSTTLGGNGYDQADAIAVDATGAVYITGSTTSADFPTTAAAVQARMPQSYGGFVAKIAPTMAGTPVVLSLDHTTGPVSGGTAIVISGRGFAPGASAGGTSVRFGDTPARAVTVSDDRTILATSPPVATAGPVTVTVTTASGTSPRNPIAQFVYGHGTWSRTENAPAVTQNGATATRLADGKVLVAGGSMTDGFMGGLRSVEIYDPVSGKWSSTAPMNEARFGHTATLLPDGTVLVAGGQTDSTSFSTLSSAELFHPATAASAAFWTLTQPMDACAAVSSSCAARSGHTATMLDQGVDKGKVLVAGTVRCGRYMSCAAAELYDPLTSTWTATGSMNNERVGHTATLLADGKVLVVGGCCIPDLVPPQENNSAELYDPNSHTWTLTDSLGEARTRHTATRLTDGSVLVTGGEDPNGLGLRSVERYLPEAPTGAKWAPVGLLEAQRYGHAGALLPSGKVLVAGGSPAALSGTTASAELFDVTAAPPASSAGRMTVPRGNPVGDAALTATLLSSSPTGFAADPAVCGANCGKVLVVGGSGDNSAELYTPEPTVTGVTPGVGPVAGGTTVTITGTGFTNVTEAVSFGGVAATRFQVDSYTEITATVPAGAAAGTVDVTVTTQGGGSATSPADKFSFAAATAPAVTLSPPSLSFSSPTVGQASAAQSVTVTNSGTGSVTVNSVTVGGANASSFAVTADTCSRASLAAGANCTVGVLFTPTATGTTLATLTITDSAADSPQSVALAGTTGTAPPTTGTAPPTTGTAPPTTGTAPPTTGTAPPTTGTAPPTAGVTVFPSSPSLTFSAPAVGQASAAQTVTLTNSGTAAVTLSKLAVSGTNAGAFATTADTCTNATLAAGATCTVDVTFTPAATGLSSATLSFTDTATGSPQTVTLSGSTTTVTVSATRIAGVDRIATAVAASRHSFPTDGSAGAVVLARADLYPDALTGVPLAAAKTAPLLLTNTAALDATTKAEITRVLPSGATVYLLGGTAALDPAVAAALSDAGFHPVRLAGTTRFSTAVAIAVELGDPDQIFEVTGTNFPDAIAAGPAVIAAHGAILLTDGSRQAPATAAYLAAHPADTRVAVGGPAASADPGATSVVGIDRYATAAALATRSFPGPTQIGLATGENFPDALAGGPVLGASGPMLLVATGTPLPAEVAAYLAAHGKAVTSVLAFGGTAVMTDGVIVASQEALQ